MEALSSIMNSGAMSTIGKAANLGTGALGTVGNIFNAIERHKLMKDAEQQQKYLEFLQKNPAALAALTRKLQAPLSMSLKQNVGNATQSFLGERGLSSSPALAASIESQSIAPYELKNQEMAQNAVLSMLGLPLDAIKTVEGTIPKDTDTSAFWKMFQPSATGSAPGSTPGLTLPTSGGGFNTPSGTLGGTDMGGGGGFDPSSLVYDYGGSPLG